MKKVLLPKALNAETLKNESHVPAQSLAITISLFEKSTAKMTLPSTAPAYPMHTFFKLYTLKGLAGIFWSTTPSFDSANGRVYALTHAIDTLRKNVYREQTTFEGTREDFVRKLFSFQDTVYWQLGSFDYGAAPYKSPNINYTNLSDLFFKFVADNPDLYPVYDFSTFPWTVNFKILPQDIEARASLTRNAESCQIVYDDKQQATRLYLAVNTPKTANGITKYETELKIYEDAEAIAQYGIFEKTASIKTDEIKGTPDQWANDFLQTHKDPTVQITVDGYELYAQTQVFFDEMKVGKRMRVALPEFGISTDQRISAVTYPDVLSRPTAVAVSLSTKQKTFTAAISNLEKEVEKVGGIAGGLSLSSANAEEVYAWSLIMQKVEQAVNGTGIVNLWETGIIIDAEAGATIYSLEQGFVSAFSALKVASDEISANSAAIKLKADLILLDGLVKATELQASVANMLLQNSLVIKTPNLQANEAVTQFLNTASLTYGGALMSKKPIEMGTVKSGPVVSESTASLNLNHSHGVTVNDADGTITLGAVVEEGAGGNFRIADTKAYKDGVSAAIANVSLSSAGWINGVNTVSASNGKTFPVSLPPFSASAGAFSSDHKAIVYFSTESVQTPLESIVVDASGVHNDGYASGVAAVTLGSSGWISGVNTVSASNGKTFPVSLPPFSASASAFNSDHKAIVYFSTASVQTPLKSIEVDASGVYDAGYAEGWAAAKARFRMDWPDQGSYDYLLNIYQPGDTPNSADVMDELQIGATYSLNEITNTAPNTFYISGWAYARTRLNGGSWTNRHRVNMTQTTTINVGQR